MGHMSTIKSQSSIHKKQENVPGAGSGGGAGVEIGGATTGVAAFGAGWAPLSLLQQALC